MKNNFLDSINWDLTDDDDDDDNVDDDEDDDDDDDETHYKVLGRRPWRFTCRSSRDVVRGLVCW